MWKWNMSKDEADEQTKRNMDSYYRGQLNGYHYNGNGNYTSNYNPHRSGYVDHNGNFHEDL